MRLTAVILLPLLLAVPGPPSRTAQPSDPAMAEQVKTELLHAWDGYKRYAWGHDDLLPVSKTCATGTARKRC